MKLEAEARKKIEEKMFELLDVGNIGCRIKCFLNNLCRRNKNIYLETFMSIKNPYIDMGTYIKKRHDVYYSFESLRNIGFKSFKKIEEIQKELEKEIEKIQNEPPKCQCDFCKLVRRIDATIERRDPDEMVALIKELADMWVCADFDNSYHKCIFDGSWPQAEEILTRSLEKVKKFKEKE